MAITRLKDDRITRDYEPTIPNDVVWMTIDSRTTRHCRKLWGHPLKPCVAITSTFQVPQRYHLLTECLGLKNDNRWQLTDNLLWEIAKKNG